MTMHRERVARFGKSWRPMIWMLAIAATGFAATPAFATHALGVYMSWVPDPSVSPLSVQLTCIAVHRLDAVSVIPRPVAVGDIYRDDETKNILWGDNLKLKSSDIKINTANRDAFVAASKPVYDLFDKDVE